MAQKPNDNNSKHATISTKDAKGNTVSQVVDYVVVDGRVVADDTKGGVKQ